MINNSRLFSRVIKCRLNRGKEKGSCNFQCFIIYLLTLMKEIMDQVARQFITEGNNCHQLLYHFPPPFLSDSTSKRSSSQDILKLINLSFYGLFKVRSYRGLSFLVHCEYLINIISLRITMIFLAKGFTITTELDEENGSTPFRVVFGGKPM